MKLFTIISFFFLSFLVTQPVNAHPGNTASDGCHYCWTNCSSWGEVYGARHCHGGGSYYIPPIPTATPMPSCPFMSTYNYGTGRCECMSGYVSNGSYCISEEQACWNEYGYNSTSDYSGGCKCRYGYVWNSSRTSCISESQFCMNQLGLMSRYSILTRRCECLSGYSIQGGKCQYTQARIIVPIYTPAPVYVPKVIPSIATDVPTPTPTIVIKKTISVPTPTSKPVVNQLSPAPKSIVTPSSTSSASPTIAQKKTSTSNNRGVAGFLINTIVNILKSIF